MGNGMGPQAGRSGVVGATARRGAHQTSGMIIYAKS